MGSYSGEAGTIFHSLSQRECRFAGIVLRVSLFIKSTPMHQIQVRLVQKKAEKTNSIVHIHWKFVHVAD
jgi:hypothetical protein